MHTIAAVLFFAVVAITFSVVPDEIHCTGDCIGGDDGSKMNRVMTIKKAQWEKCAEEGRCPNTKVHDLGATPCVNGYAGEYPCCNTDLLSFVSLESLGASGDGNDIWGWVDPEGREYAIFGAYDGSSFIDITDPSNPSVLGFLPTHSVGSLWRDIKVYKDHAFIISEASQHGMQVFDLNQLRTLPRIPIFDANFSASAVPEFSETAHYGEFSNCHNIAINEDTGFAYGVGSNTCRAGLHMIDIRVPTQPRFAGCFSDDGYVHDTQCVVYSGPDLVHRGKEICFCFNEDTLTIVDVTTKSNPIMLARQSYTGYQYTHQGWLLPGQRYLLLDDELDELYNSNHHTRTLVWDVSVLSSPRYINSFYSELQVIDHNLYTIGDRAYSANYCGGLRILDTSRVASDAGLLTQAGYFDVSPDCDSTQFLGSWSNYPYFPSGTIVISSIDRGLFVVKYNGEADGC
jgi:choice-of-anchor B domain-containing protein